MTNRFRSVFLTSLIACGVFYADAQTARPGPRTTSAETGLVGVRLLDSGTRVIQLFGSPDEILGLNAGGGGSVGGGGGGGGSAPAGGRGGGGGGGETREQAGADFSVNRPATPGLIGDPFGQGELRQLRPNNDGREGNAGSGDGAPSTNAPTTGSGGAAAGGGGGGAGERVIYTRWVYKRQNAHYAFVFDKFNRVVQIEALGLRDSRVRTRKGVSFGATFSDLIRRYGAPDAYEIGGDTIVVRFLVKDRVAFRLSRTEPKKPHRVTGVVVAAGKA